MAIREGRWICLQPNLRTQPWKTARIDRLQLYVFAGSKRPGVAEVLLTVGVAVVIDRQVTDGVL